VAVKKHLGTVSKKTIKMSSEKLDFELRETFLEILKVYYFTFNTFLGVRKIGSVVVLIVSKEYKMILT
jgi:hypothetical protein